MSGLDLSAIRPGDRVHVRGVATGVMEAGGRTLIGVCVGAASIVVYSSHIVAHAPDLAADDAEREEIGAQNPSEALAGRFPPLTGAAETSAAAPLSRGF